MWPTLDSPSALSSLCFYPLKFFLFPSPIMQIQGSSLLHIIQINTTSPGCNLDDNHDANSSFDPQRLIWCSFAGNSTLTRCGRLSTTPTILILIAYVHSSPTILIVAYLKLQFSIRSQFVTNDLPPSKSNKQNTFVLWSTLPVSYERFVISEATVFR